jgi:hypothetical protein
MNYKHYIKNLKNGGLLDKVDRGYISSTDNKSSWYIFYYNWFVLLITSMFEWENLPDSIDPIYLEKMLNLNGYVGFLLDENFGFIVQNGTLSNQLDIYENPTKFTIVNPNYHKLARFEYNVNNYSDLLNTENVTIINNDFFQNSTFYYADKFATELADLEQTIRLVRNTYRCPYVFLTSEDNKLAMKNFYQKIQDGEQVIYLKSLKDKAGIGETSLLDKVQVLNLANTNANVLEDLYNEKKRIINTYLNYIGITYNDNGKKERLITDEVNSQDGITASSLESRLKARRKSVDLINQCYGLDIEVNISKNIQIHNLEMFDESIDELENIEDLGLVKEDGKIYDDNSTDTEKSE